VLRQWEGHPRIERIVYNPTNDRLRGPTNWFWNQNRDAEFLGKVDDDCLVPDWCETLGTALRTSPKPAPSPAALSPRI
jgi:hypothetical protein